MSSKAKKLIKEDIARYGGQCPGFLKSFHKYFRLAQNTTNRFLSLYYRFRFNMIKEKRGLEIPYSLKCGKGLYLGHAYNITINGKAVIGENVNIHKGVTIGQENRGKRKGTPTIGNRVWIGINATVVGNITIGDDVLIAPNAYVNCDVPSHSIVIGNPCEIRPRDNATEDYVINMV